jgi:GT2 family glycosyltransferase
MADDRTIFDEPHHQSLELLAARALANGDPMAAFRLADRRCRINPAPEPHSYILRAEAARRLGDRVGAVSDIEKAIDLAPEDLAANRKLLAWGGGEQQARAARALVAIDHDPHVLRKATRVLFDDGRTVLANLSVLDNMIEGWVAWRGQGAFEVSVTNGLETMTAAFDRDPFHPFAGEDAAASFSLPRPKSTTPQTIALSGPQGVFHSVRAAANCDGGTAQSAPPARAPFRQDAGVSVIVPIYGDYEATRACLDSLLAELKTAPLHRALLVNDATPDRRIADYLTALARIERIEVLTNPSNLGFIGSVNRALAHTSEGDVVLLNADTLVPRGFIDGLAAAARSSSDIGTVTPLSNNGEFTSFPIANTANAAPTQIEVASLNRIAASANAGVIIDIPSGIGFCLYVTRACLDATGPLSEDYYRGYLEDVDFCLRARERGFRNVCASSVYVGHAGSKSFGAEKRSLVVRNLETLKRRFPKHRAECAAFALADPLRFARDQIERAAPAPRRRPRLLITCEGALSQVARARAMRLASQGRRAIILEMRQDSDGVNARFLDPSGDQPQSVRFALASLEERSAMRAYLRKLRPTSGEFIDIARVPVAIADLLSDLDIPFDMFIADAGLLGEHHGIGWGIQKPARGEDRPVKMTRRAIADRARGILAPSREARAFARTLLPDRTINLEAPPRRARANPAPDAKSARNLGIVSIRSDVHEQRLLSAVARGLGEDRSDASITVVGATLDDIHLMQFANVHVVGKVDEGEFARAIEVYQLSALFVVATRPIFGHPMLSRAAASGLPFAALDWTMGGVKPRRRDLAINPHLGLDAIVAALVAWVAQL